MGIIASVLDILLVPAADVDTGWNESAMMLWIMRWALLENDGAKKAFDIRRDQRARNQDITKVC